MEKRPMYKMKSIYEGVSNEIISTSTMYRMKNLMADESENGLKNNEPENGLKNIGIENIEITVEQLVERQLQILTNLKLLREEVEEMWVEATSLASPVIINKKTEEQSVGKKEVYDVKECNKTITKNVRKISVKQVGQSIPYFSSDLDYTKNDIVIHADPKFPPYSLLSLRYLYGEQLKLNIISRIHPSLESFPDHLQSFFSLRNNYTLPHINVIVKWGEVGKDSHLVLSPVKHKVILGEVNILRFFDMMAIQKTGCIEWSDHLDTEVRMISTLDWAHQFRHFEGKRSELLAILEKRIKERKWLVIDEDATIGDVSVWSVLTAYNKPNVQPVVRDWFDNCTRTFI